MASIDAPSSKIPSPFVMRNCPLFSSCPHSPIFIRPHLVPEVSLVCKKSTIRIALISILSLAAMAANTQLAIVSPAYRTTHARSSFEIVEDDETLSPRSHPQTQSETPVKVGCCTCIRKRKNRKNDANTKASRKAQQKAMRARIKAFIRYTWIDTLVLFVFGIVILCLYWAPNNLRNPPVIPIWPALPRDGNTTGKLVDLRAPTEFQYPWQKSPLSDMVCAVIITTVPIVVIALFQLRIRSCWDFYAGQLGVLKAVTTT